MVIDNYTHNIGMYMVLGHNELAPTTHHPLDVCYYRVEDEPQLN
jgi:hypothetical protein